MAHLFNATPVRRAIETLSSTSMTDVSWDDVVNFYGVFGKILEEEEAAAIKKKYFGDKDRIPQDRALDLFSDFVKNEEFVTMLQSECKVLSKTKQTVHHAEDFRYMLKQLSEELPEVQIDDFIREALGKGDDTFDLATYIAKIAGFS